MVIFSFHGNIDGDFNYFNMKKKFYAEYCHKKL